MRKSPEEITPAASAGTPAPVTRAPDEIGRRTPKDTADGCVADSVGGRRSSRRALLAAAAAGFGVVAVESVARAKPAAAAAGDDLIL